MVETPQPPGSPAAGVFSGKSGSKPGLASGPASPHSILALGAFLIQLYEVAREPLRVLSLFLICAFIH